MPTPRPPGPQPRTRTPRRSHAGPPTHTRSPWPDLCCTFRGTFWSLGCSLYYQLHTGLVCTDLLLFCYFLTFINHAVARFMYLPCLRPWVCARSSYNMIPALVHFGVFRPFDISPHIPILEPPGHTRGPRPQPDGPTRRRPSSTSAPSAPYGGTGPSPAPTARSTPPPHHPTPPPPPPIYSVK